MTGTWPALCPRNPGAERGDLARPGPEEAAHGASEPGSARAAGTEAWREARASRAPCGPGRAWNLAAPHLS